MPDRGSTSLLGVLLLCATSAFLLQATEAVRLPAYLKTHTAAAPQDLNSSASVVPTGAAFTAHYWDPALALYHGALHHAKLVWDAQVSKCIMRFPRATPAPSVAGVPSARVALTSQACSHPCAAFHLHLSPLQQTCAGGQAALSFISGDAHDNLSKTPVLYHRQHDIPSCPASRNQQQTMAASEDSAVPPAASNLASQPYNTTVQGSCPANYSDIALKLNLPQMLPVRSQQHSSRLPSLSSISCATVPAFWTAWPTHGATQTQTAISLQSWWGLLQRDGRSHRVAASSTPTSPTAAQSTAPAASRQVMLLQRNMTAGLCFIHDRPTSVIGMRMYVNGSTLRKQQRAHNRAHRKGMGAHRTKVGQHVAPAAAAAASEQQHSSSSWLGRLFHLLGTYLAAACVQQLKAVTAQAAAIRMVIDSVFPHLAAHITAAAIATASEWMSGVLGQALLVLLICEAAIWHHLQSSKPLADQQDSGDTCSPDSASPHGRSKRARSIRRNATRATVKRTRNNKFKHTREARQPREERSHVNSQPATEAAHVNSQPATEAEHMAPATGEKHQHQQEPAGENLKAGNNADEQPRPQNKPTPPSSTTHAVSTLQEFMQASNAALSSTNAALSCADNALANKPCSPKRQLDTAQDTAEDTARDTADWKAEYENEKQRNEELHAELVHAKECAAAAEASVAEAKAKLVDQHKCYAAAEARAAAAGACTAKAKASEAAARAELAHAYECAAAYQDVAAAADARAVAANERAAAEAARAATAGTKLAKALRLNKQQKADYERQLHDKDACMQEATQKLSQSAAAQVCAEQKAHDLQTANALLQAACEALQAANESLQVDTELLKADNKSLREDNDRLAADLKAQIKEKVTMPASETAPSSSDCPPDTTPSSNHSPLRRMLSLNNYQPEPAPSSGDCSSNESATRSPSPSLSGISYQPSVDSTVHLRNDSVDSGQPSHNGSMDMLSRTLSTCSDDMHTHPPQKVPELANIGSMDPHRSMQTAATGRHLCADASQQASQASGEEPNMYQLRGQGDYGVDSLNATVRQQQAPRASHAKRGHGSSQFAPAQQQHAQEHDTDTQAVLKDGKMGKDHHETNTSNKSSNGAAQCHNKNTCGAYPIIPTHMQHRLSFSATQPCNANQDVTRSCDNVKGGDAHGALRTSNKGCQPPPSPAADFRSVLDKLPSGLRARITFAMRKASLDHNGCDINSGLN